MSETGKTVYILTTLGCMAIMLLLGMGLGRTSTVDDFEPKLERAQQTANAYANQARSAMLASESLQRRVQALYKGNNVRCSEIEPGTPNTVLEGRLRAIRKDGNGSGDTAWDTPKGTCYIKWSDTTKSQVVDYVRFYPFEAEPDKVGP